MLQGMVVTPEFVIGFLYVRQIIECAFIRANKA